MAPIPDDIQRLIAEASVLAGGTHQCTILGHAWIHRGGANCGCSDTAGCSVPVYECKACGDCDYGDNAEAHETRRVCREDAP